MSHADSPIGMAGAPFKLMQAGVLLLPPASDTALGCPIVFGITLRPPLAKRVNVRDIIAQPFQNSWDDNPVPEWRGVPVSKNILIPDGPVQRYGDPWIYYSNFLRPLIRYEEEHPGFSRQLIWSHDVWDHQVLVSGIHRLQRVESINRHLNLRFPSHILGLSRSHVFNVNDYLISRLNANVQLFKPRHGNHNPRTLSVASSFVLVFHQVSLPFHQHRLTLYGPHAQLRCLCSLRRLPRLPADYDQSQQNNPNSDAFRPCQEFVSAWYAIGTLVCLICGFWGMGLGIRQNRRGLRLICILGWGFGAGVLIPTGHQYYCPANSDKHSEYRQNLEHGGTVPQLDAREALERLSSSCKRAFSEVCGIGFFLRFRLLER